MKIQELSAREKLIYCAGLLEGEGTFFGIENSKGYGFSIGITCQMCDYEPIYNLYRILGGNLNGPYPPSKYGTLPFYVWSVRQRIKVVLICNAIKQFMSPRRQIKITNLLQIAKDYPITRNRIAKHGTYTMYNNYKCRCKDCCSARSLRFKITGN